MQFKLDETTTSLCFVAQSKTPREGRSCGSFTSRSSASR
jgi:hypothetical protein